MGLQIEILVGEFGDAAIDQSSALGIARAICIRLFRGIEASMMSLADDDDGELRDLVLRVGRRENSFGRFAEGQ